MKRRKLKPFVLPTIYALSFILIFVGTYLSVLKISKVDQVTEEDITYVSSIIVSSDIPVINTDDKISKPYTDKTVTIARNFYNKDAEETDQIKSLIYYNKTYMPNSGIDYKSDKPFDVVTILSGTVTKVIEDDLLGKTIEVKHGNNLTSTYQGLSNAKVAINDIVTQGQVIASSGTSTLNKDLGNHLHFELYYQGQVVNPENYYGKTLKEL